MRVTPGAYSGPPLVCSANTRNDGCTAMTRQTKGDPMSHIYRVSEIVGTSPDGVDAAIQAALARAAKKLRNIEWFEVVSVRGQADESGVLHFQVTVKVGFRLED